MRLPGLLCSSIMGGATTAGDSTVEAHPSVAAIGPNGGGLRQPVFFFVLAGWDMVGFWYPKEPFLLGHGWMEW